MSPQQTISSGEKIHNFALLASTERKGFFSKIPTFWRSNRHKEHLLEYHRIVDELEKTRTQAVAERAKFEGILQQMPLAVVIGEAPSGRIIFRNKQVHRVLRHQQVSEGSIDTYKDPRGFHMDGRPVKPEEYPLARAIRQDEHAVDKHFRYFFDDGTVGIISASASPIKDGSGNIVAGIVIFDDITEKLAVENALEASELRFKTLANSIPQLAWMTDEKGIPIWCNQRWFDYTGTTSIAFDEGEWKNIYHPQHIGRVLERFYQCVRDGEPWEDTFPLRRHDGVFRWFLSRAEPIRNPKGEITGWFGTNTDINDSRDLLTQLQQAKEIAEAGSKAKSEFLANMSHEIRTPLSAMLGFADLLQDDQIQRSDKESYLQTIIRNGKNLARLIDDILDLSRIEAGRLRVEMADVLVRDILNETLATFSQKVKEKGLTIALSVSPSVPSIIKTDPARLRQILVNIIGNAVKFSSQGTISVTASLASSKLVIVVKDQGPGIPDEEHSRLFHPFTQVDSSATRQQGGTGLGLALSRRLARALGGDIVLSPYVANEGCTFTISIDIYESESYANERGDQSLQDELPKDRLGFLLAGVRVLVIEDSPDNSLYMRKTLEREAIIVDVAENGKEGIMRALAVPYDLIFMDMQMSLIDGYEATRRIRKHGYGGPIIALTAHAMAEDRAKSLEAGCTAHVTKPIAPFNLVSLVAAYGGKPRPFSS
ncbi:MAG: ATP-binding protein [Oligoflexales bacterium]